MDFSADSSVPPLRVVIDDAVAELASDPAVKEAENDLVEAIRDLRWAHGLRKRWQESRLESGVWAAVAACESLGVQADYTTIRLFAGGCGKPVDGEAPVLSAAEQAVAVGAVRAHEWVRSVMPPLNVGPGHRPAPVSALTALPAIHSAYTSLIDADSAGIAVRSPDVEVALLSSAQHGLVRLALFAGELLRTNLWKELAQPASWVAIRWAATELGVDPTGVLVWDVAARSRGAVIDKSLRNYSRNNDVIPWILAVSEVAREAAREGRAVVDSIVAGVPRR